MKSLYFLFFFLFVSLFAFSQKAKDTLTLEQQFDKIYRISTSYQEYKVIRKTRFQNLKQNVSDSLNALKKQNSTKDKLILSQKDSMTNLKKIATTFEADLKQTIVQKNSIKILGIELDKSTYNIIVWSLMSILIILLLYFMYQFKNGDLVTKSKV